PAWVAGAPDDFGGSHGGHGARHNHSGTPGDVYDSVYRPQLPGGGGSTGSHLNGGPAGGGVVELIADEVVLDGDLLAAGGARARAACGGGGTVIVEANRLSGAGQIDVSGGNSTWHGGPGYMGKGGGGRAALWVGDLTGFDVDTQVDATAGVITNGVLAPFAAPGTIFVRDGAATYGYLLVDAGTDADGAVQPSTPTVLPTLGEGPVVGFEVDGADAWLTRAEPFRPRHLGAYVTLEGAGGAELGTFAVAELDEAGRIRLDGAGTVPAADAASWRGRYLFDDISVRNGAGVDSADPVTGSGVVLEGDVRVGGDIVAESLLVKAGSRVRPAAGRTS
ncbi:MAG: hypothetical protein AAFX50_26900, partial [Acidobacteriota bacterium]